MLIIFEAKLSWEKEHISVRFSNHADSYSLTI